MIANGGIYAPKKQGDAGYDLESSHRGIIFSKSHMVFETAARVAIPDGYCGVIIGRSSLNTIGIFCVVGLVDSGYRGYIKVVLQNNSTQPYEVFAGDRIAQMILLPYGNFPLEAGNLDDTERGTDGFGSTGR